MPLEDLENELYKKDSDITEQRRPKERAPREIPKVDEAWKEPPKRIYDEPTKDIGLDIEETIGKTRKWWRPVLITASGVFFVAIVVSAFFIYQSLTARGINIEVNTPGTIKIGEPVDITVSINNNSSNFLDTSRLSLQIPEGMVIVGKSENNPIEDREIGSISVGAFKKETFQIIALSGDNTVKRLTLTLKYDPTSVGSSFEKSVERDVAVSGHAVETDLRTSNKVFSGENFELSLDYKNASSIEYKEIKIQAIYPPTFSFKSASIEPTEGTNIWSIENLSPKESGKISIQGNIVGQDQSFFDVKFELIATIEGQEYKIAEQSANVSVSSSSLGLSIFLNETRDYIAEPGDLLTYTFQFANNTRVGLQDVVLKAQLIGEMFDFSQIVTNGFVSSNRVVTWNAANTPAFRNLAPDARGAVEIRIPVKNSYKISKLNDKNFTLKVDGEIESPTVPNLVGAERTVGINSLTTKLKGIISVDAKGLFHDPSSGIVNSGAIPPRVNLPTTYTIHWIVKNQSTDISNVELTGFLQAGVRWTGEVSSNLGTEPEYNERTQEVTWKIPQMRATQGIIGDPAEAIFQVEAIPSIDLVNREMPLISETKIRAFDEFVQTEISNSDARITTNIFNDDPTVLPTQGVVQQ